MAAPRKDPGPGVKLLGRALWLKIHRWLGLGFGVVLMLVGLTGSANVYHRLFDEWLSPSFYRPLSQGPSLPMATLLARAHEYDETPIVTVLLDRPVLLIHQRHPGAMWRTSIDKASGQLIARRDQTHSFLPTLLRLHENLLLEPYWGGELVGLSGLALALSCASGLYLWWPRPGGFRKALWVRARARSWARWMLDWHRVLGFWSTVVLLLVALSGFYLSFPLGVRYVVRWFSPVRTKRAPHVTPGEGPGVGPDRILEVAQKARPQDVPIVLDLPDEDTPLWRVALRPRNWNPSAGGLTQLWIDPWRETVAGELSLDNATAGEWLIAQQFPLHNGSLGGEAGRFLVFLSGLALPFLAFSGGFVYFNRLRLQRRARKG